MGDFEAVPGMISVVIPYYNREKTIIPCIQSVLEQTYKNIEVIVVDDGSERPVQNVLEDVDDPRVRCIRYVPNHGACHARNVGADAARGEYIAFQDSDDTWLPEKLEKQLKSLIEKDVEFLFCGMNRTSLNKQKLEFYPVFGYDEKKDPLEQLLAVNRISTQTMLMRREVMQKIRFDETFRKSQDWDFAIQAALAGVKIGYLPEALVDSQVQPDSITATVKAGPVREQLYEKYVSELQKHPEAHAKFLEDTARCFKSQDREKSVHYLRLSMKEQFTVKRCVKYLLTVMGLMK